MKLRYTVHTVSESPFPIVAQVNGKDREVTVQGLVVEIMDEQGASTLTLRISDDLDAARKLFERGKPVTLTITAGGK